MPDARPSLFARDDTFLGVCEGIAEDFGMNPLWLRLVFTFAVFAHPIGAVSVYLALGVVVFAVRRFVPSAPDEAARPGAAALRLAGNDQAPVPTARAA